MDAIQRPGNETVDEALRWLGRSASGRSSSGSTSTTRTRRTPRRGSTRRSFPRTLAGAYDAEIAYADAQLGRLLDALEGDGRLERTVVAVLGDHGEMLGEHGELTHGFFVYDAAVRIPLVMAAPGLAPRVVKDQVRIVDVMPTLLELLEVPAAACRAGHEPAAARARGAAQPAWRSRRAGSRASTTAGASSGDPGRALQADPRPAPRALRPRARSPRDGRPRRHRPAPRARRSSARSSGCSPPSGAAARRSCPRPWTPRRPSGCRRSATSAAR